MKKAQYKKTKSGKSWDFEWQLAECRWYCLIANSKRKKRFTYSQLSKKVKTEET